MCMCLRWMCCGGGVACCVECTNSVKKWKGSDCDHRGYQGREVGFSHSVHRPGVSRDRYSERKKDNRFSKKIYSECETQVSSPHHCHGQMMPDPPPPCHMSACWSVVHVPVFEVCTCTTLTIFTVVEVAIR